MPRDTAFQSGAQELKYIQLRAQALGLDAGAVLAVAAHEGITLPSKVGDSGHSFGPWQLNYQGKLPGEVWERGPAYSQQWANSPAGLDYALGGIASVLTAGERGAQAISDIVYKFEQPREDLRAGEVARSIATYNAGGMPAIAAGGGDGGGILDTITNLPGDFTTGVGDLVGGAKSAPGALVGAAGDLLGGPVGWVENILQRGGKIVLGAGLLLLGLYLVARSFNMAPSPGQLAAIATRGAVGGRGGPRKAPSGPQAAPRRQGDAAAARGEPVTQGGQPAPHTAATRRAHARTTARSDRAAAAAKREREAPYGDDIPF